MTNTEYACPGCGCRLSVEDLRAGECPQYCGETFPKSDDVPRADLPRWG